MKIIQFIKIVLCFLFILISSCKDEIAKEEKKDILVESTKINNLVTKKLSCDKIIRKVIELCCSLKFRQ